jgi:hypothetical protein
VQNAVVGQVLEIGIILPPNVVPSAYYMYGPTAENPDPHWYEFEFDGETGAVVINGVTFTTSDQRSFTRNVLKVFHKDGGRGDSDMQANGVIEVTGGLPVSIVTDGGSGSLSYFYLVLAGILLIVRRNIAENPAPAQVSHLGYPR